MPKDEVDPEDPMSMMGVALPATAMEVEETARCFIEEFAWIGFDKAKLLSLFRDPTYFGVHVIYQQMGEQWVRGVIDRVAAEWGVVEPVRPGAEPASTVAGPRRLPVVHPFADPSNRVDGRTS